MNEIYIHATSHLYYNDIPQSFTYIAETMEIALFGCDGIQMDTNHAPHKKHELCILEEQQIYTFHLPSKSVLLITKLPLFQEDESRIYEQSVFQNEEIAVLCIQLAAITKQDKKSNYLLQSYIQKLCFLILNHYTYHGEKEKGYVPIPNENRIRQIKEIIHTQSRENITLVSLAEQLHLTPPYVSQIFTVYFGCTFLRYVANVRLYKAMKDIQHSTKTVLEIAMEQGFANVRSFQNIFQLNFHCTPKQYRKKFHQRTAWEQHSKNSPIYTQFLHEQQDTMSKPDITQEEHYKITLKANEKGTHLQHTWKRLTTVGRARLLLNDDIRKHLVAMQEDIGFEMIRFHGIFNEDMHVYDEDAQGSSIYNFHQVNNVLDFLLKIGLKPFLEIGYMPKKLALYPDMKILDHIFLVSPPKDIEKWQKLVQAFLINCINRYGEEEVLSWYFEFWNNGGLDYKGEGEDRTQKFWQGSLEEYLQFYEATYHAIKAINSKLRIGGPSASINLIKQYSNNFSYYLKYMRQNKCMVDFITFHVYPSYTGDLTGIYYTDLPSFQHLLDTAKSWMKRNKLDMELYISEWSTWGYKEQPNFNDTCAKAIYLVKSMVDSLDQVNAMGHWTFSDYTETMNTTQYDIYSGKVGLITTNGIKKAAYHAFTLMSKLGDIQISKGDNYIFTKRNKNYQLLVFHYQNPNDKIEATAYFHMKLQQLTNGTYEKKVYILNKESGSSYDVWRRMGSYQEISEEDVAYLNAFSKMSYTREVIQINNQEEHLTKNLKDEEALLIEWNYKYS